jgi:hypothetical protein
MKNGLLSLLSVALMTAAAPAQPLFLQPEHPVAAPRSGVPSLRQNSLATATDGTNHLLIWRDSRNDLPAHHSVPADSDLVCAARVDSRGTVLDSPSLVLPLKGKAIPFWNGREFVVVAAEEYVRISASGELLDPVARPYAAPHGALYSIAWTGERLLVIATRIDDSGPVTFASTVFAHGASDWRSILVFGDVLKNIAYLRLAPESPYADTWHLFIRGTGAGRERAVR